MTPEVEKARAILQATRHLQFDEHPSVDLQDRLGLLTVVVGLREVAAFGFAERANEDRLRALKDILSNHGLPTQVTRQVRSASHHHSLDISPELAEVFDRTDAESYERDPGRLLWVCRNPKTREQIKLAVAGEIPTGTLLGYPKCCVEQDRRDKALHGEAFCRAIVSATKNEPIALERALRHDLEVEMAFDSPLGCDMEATEERFPFVQHIACGACLSSDDSPSARLNLKYEQLAREIDPAFHAVLSEMAKVTASIGRIVDEAESKGLSKETLDSEIKHQLRNLFQDQERIFAGFLGRGRIDSCN
jgi:hypothetical protein